MNKCLSAEGLKVRKDVVLALLLYSPDWCL
jgi:hypothetical protein